MNNWFEHPFWRQYPSSEPELREVVSSTDGVRTSVTLPPSTRSRLKAQYGQLSRSKARSLYRVWKTSPASFEQGRPAALMDALREFSQDYEIQQRRFEEEMELCLQELPPAPPGYFWASYSECLSTGSTMWFRLWHSDLGYPPQSG